MKTTGQQNLFSSDKEVGTECPRSWTVDAATCCGENVNATADGLQAGEMLF